MLDGVRHADLSVLAQVLLNLSRVCYRLGMSTDFTGELLA
jgi:hypothetical protein